MVLEKVWLSQESYRSFDSGAVAVALRVESRHSSVLRKE